METFADEIGVWEIMNEPATTNVVNLPHAAVQEIFAASAAQISAANRPGLVNSPHEFSHGAKYLIHGTDNRPAVRLPAHVQHLSGRAVRGGVDGAGEHHRPSMLPRLPPERETSLAASRVRPSRPAICSIRLDRYARFGKPLHITEFTLPDAYGDSWHSGYWKAPWTPELQAEYAEAVYTLAYAHPQLHSITWWDAAAANPAVIGGSLLDAAGKPKPVLDRIAALLRTWHATEPITLAGAKTLTQSLPGGVYTVTVDAPGVEAHTETVHVLERWSRPLSIDLGGQGSGQG
jgi:hypothetical protein